MPTRLILSAALVLLSAACGAEDAPRIAEAAPAAVVDSILPVEEALRRFRADLPPPDSLESGYTDRDSLVAAFGRALFRADTATLAELLMSRAEFAYLYYPASHFSREPYELDPALLWFQIQNGTSQGITRALRRYGGVGYEYAGHECEAEPAARDGIRLWERCVVSYRDARGEHLSGRFFGSVLEHGGRYRIVSYSNPL